MMSSAENAQLWRRLTNIDDPPAKLMVGGEIIPDQLKKATKVTDDLRNHLCIRDVLPVVSSENEGVA
jgi:hypothetical protein